MYPASFNLNRNPPPYAILIEKKDYQLTQHPQQNKKLPLIYSISVFYTLFVIEQTYHLCIFSLNPRKLSRSSKEVGNN